MSNNLIIIENGQLMIYRLDDRLVWEVGRPSKDNNPDVKLYSLTVSRKHGRFQNRDGNWFYIDYLGKNGTVYKNQKIMKNLRGRARLIPLADKDILIFGGGEKQIIDSKTIWAYYTKRDICDQWRVVDTKKYKSLCFSDGKNKTTSKQREKGEVIGLENGMAIYMGNLTYINGSIKVESVNLK